MYYTPGNRTHGSENVQISNAEKKLCFEKNENLIQTGRVSSSKSKQQRWVLMFLNYVRGKRVIIFYSNLFFSMEIF